mmetsp:Transcript_23550/g.65307  ORF Transcript_23550/g.65307 Transcript_23550/m.65307 type:complete len:209 (+) Transcript_23550:2130-2756(+)
MGAASKSAGRAVSGITGGLQEDSSIETSLPGFTGSCWASVHKRVTFRREAGGPPAEILTVTSGAPHAEGIVGDLSSTPSALDPSAVTGLLICGEEVAPSSFCCSFCALRVRQAFFICGLRQVWHEPQRCDRRTRGRPRGECLRPFFRPATGCCPGGEASDSEVSDTLGEEMVRSPTPGPLAAAATDAVATEGGALEGFGAPHRGVVGC